jgi:SNF2 family DNA or RNA helicase
VYRPRTEPMRHQALALERIAARPTHPSRADVFALQMEMGTGKTWVVLTEWGTRASAGDLDALLVLAPAGSYRNWFDRPEVAGEWSQHLDPEFAARTPWAAWVSGGGVAATRRVEAVLAARGPRALFMNIEALSSVERARAVAREFLETSRAPMMVIDESTTIRSPDAARTEAVIALGERAAARRIMTGLIAPRAPLDLYTQFQFLDWRILGHRSFYSFRERYAVMKRVDFKQVIRGKDGTERKAPPRPIIVGYRRSEELHALTAPYSYRVLKEQCLDLAPKTYAVREVEPTPQQAKAYQDLLRRATTELESGAHVTATHILTGILRRHQVLCGHVVDEEGRLHDIPDRRVAALSEVLAEHGGKAIVWVTYTHTLDKVRAALEREYGRGSTAAFHGGNRSTRHEDEARFLGDPRCRFMVATQSAGGRGNNWTVADLVVYYANSPDLEHRMQSEDRAHRRGQTRPVTYVDLMVRGTVDEKFVTMLRKKLDIASSIQGDARREWLI